MGCELGAAVSVAVVAVVVVELLLMVQDLLRYSEEGFELEVGPS